VEVLILIFISPAPWFRWSTRDQ